MENYKDFNSFFKYTSTPTVWVQNDLSVANLNPALSGILGFHENELLCRPIDELLYEKKGSLAQQINLSGKPFKDFEVCFVHKTGKPVWALVSGTLTNFKNSKTPGFLLSIKDITHSKLNIQNKEKVKLLKMQTLQRIKKSKKVVNKQLLKDKSKSLVNFKVDLHHNINNFLSIILGHINILQSAAQSRHSVCSKMVLNSCKIISDSCFDISKTLKKTN